MRYPALVLLSIFVLFSHTTIAQVRTVSGVVTNSENDKPLSGVSVTVKNTTIGTITDDDGRFMLHLPKNTQLLVFSFIGMQTKDVPINNKWLEVELKPGYIGVDEVLVMGYTRKERSETTGSVVQVNGDEIANIPVTSFEQALQGKVPGLVVATTSGTPGSFHDIRIHGVGSITAGNDPLIVVDGVPVINEDLSGFENQSSLGTLSALNSYDIETVTVLKDASATSMYGARGANGVIVVTTKKGKIGETRFNANAFIGFRNNAVEGMVPLTGAQKSELLQEAAYNSFGALYNFDKDDSYDYLVNVIKVPGLKSWNGEEANWNKLLLNKNAVVQNYHINASGGDEMSSFYASLGYNKTDATVIGSGFERFSGKLNYNRNFSGSVRFSTNISLSNARQKGIVEPSVYFRNPHISRYMMSPWEQPYLEDGETYNLNVSPPIPNNLYTLENDILTNDLTRGITNSFLEWTVIPRFKLKTLFAMDYNLAAYHNYVNRVHGGGVNAGGFTNQSVSRNFNFISQNSLDYSVHFDNQSLALKAILEYQKNKYNYLSGYGENFVLDGMPYLQSAGSNFDASSMFTDWKHVSYLGILSYGIASKYLADFTFRSEGSSRFAPGNRFGNFWSVGAAWNIIEEDFMADLHSVNNLRLKASYGVSGNSAIGINRYQPVLSFDANYAGQGAVYPAQYGNNTLTWEKNRNLNTGLEFSFFQAILEGSVSYYHRNTYDLLQDVPLSRTTGHGIVLMNSGAIVNKGIEVMVNANIIRSAALNVGVSANFATVNNEVTELATDDAGNELNIETTAQKVAVGQPVFGWYLREWAGVNPDNGAAQWYLNGAGSPVTENYSDPDIQKVWLGSPIPKYTGGFNIHADYKGFFADAGFYFAAGHKVYEDFSYYTHSSGFKYTQNYNFSDVLLNRWQEPGNITDVPKLIYGTNSDSNVSSRFLYDGDYLRVKNLVVGYKIPAEYSKSIGFDEINLSVRGTNLFTWVKDSRLKFDPEVGGAGYTSFNTPPVKSIVFGVNLKF